MLFEEFPGLHLVLGGPHFDFAKVPVLHLALPHERTLILDLRQKVNGYISSNPDCDVKDRSMCSIYVRPYNVRFPVTTPAVDDGEAKKFLTFSP